MSRTQSTAGVLIKGPGLPLKGTYCICILHAFTDPDTQAHRSRVVMYLHFMLLLPLSTLPSTPPFWLILSPQDVVNALLTWLKSLLQVWNVFCPPSQPYILCSLPCYCMCYASCSKARSSPLNITSPPKTNLFPLQWMVNQNVSVWTELVLATWC